MLMKRTLFAIMTIFAALDLAYADGAIQFRNNTLTRMKMMAFGGSLVDVPLGASIVYGVFFSYSNECPTLVMPLGTASTTTPGLIDAPSPFVIPGTSEGDTVYLHIKSWGLGFGANWCDSMRHQLSLAGVTGPIRVTLGGTNTPTTIWQGLTGTNPNRFTPLIVGGISSFILSDINDITATEGTNGFANATFTVTRRQGYYNCCLGYSVTETFTTTNRTALAGQDYLATSGGITFAPGELSKTISVVLTAYATPEPDETFAVVLGPSYYYSDMPVGTCVITEAYVIGTRFEGADTLVTIHTVTGRNYALESSADLTSWTAVEGADHITGVGGPMTLRDAGVGLDSFRFYRMRLLTQ
jgi:hypothetical protein